jgi:coenzyme F420-dependent glucose-6-phosphate dehydrogenase
LPKVRISLDLGENYFDPNDFVDAAVDAEQLGFRKLWFGDHFAPMFHSGNRASFVWSVISAALAKTREVAMGPLVTTPIGARYHPALVAQACATLDNMFPGRLQVSVGTGEALNEAPFWNYKWPGWKERIDRLCEGVTLMRRLWKETKPFSFRGKYFSSEFYYLYTHPRTEMQIYFSALGEKTAYYAGSFGDHLVTLSPLNDAERIRNVLLPQYERGCSDAKKEKGSLVVHIDYSFKEPAQLLKESRVDLSGMAKGAFDAKTPIEVEELGKKLTLSDVKRVVHSPKDWNHLMKVLETYVDVGASELILPSAPVKKEIEQVAKNVLDVF